MHFSSTNVAVGLLGIASYLVPVAKAHMMMATPEPYGIDSLNNSPLDASGADFPCKQRAGVYDISQENKLTAGVDNTLSFTGSAVHGGGSCQLSLSKDREPTAKSSFKVFVSFEGGCPGIDGPTNFTYQIPKDAVPNGKYALAWTWFNKIGNREMYMNCAPVTISGSSGTDDTFNALADMFVANVGNGCSDTETTDLKFPNPGKVVVKGASATLAPPTGSNCAAPSGASQEPAAQATASTGGASGGGGDAGSSGSSGSSGSGGSGADNSGQCTGSCLGGGASGGSDGGSGSGAGAASPAASSPAASSPAAASPDSAASSASSAASSNTGGVFAPNASGAATTAAGVTETPVPPPATTPDSASSTSTLTTLMTVTSGAGSDAGSTQSPAAPIPSAAPAPAGNGAGSAASSAAPVAPAPPAGSGTAGSAPGAATGSTCTTPGAVVCNGASQFGICNVDNTVVWQQVAAGTTCSNGQITKRGLAWHVHGGPRRNFFGW